MNILKLTKEKNKEKIGDMNLYLINEFSKGGIFIECEDGKPSKIIIK